MSDTAANVDLEKPTQVQGPGSGTREASNKPTATEISKRDAQQKLGQAEPFRSEAKHKRASKMTSEERDLKKRKNLKPKTVKEDSDLDLGSEPEILDGLSGDEVDKSNIIEGGSRTRRNASSMADQVKKYQSPAADDSDQDSW